MRRREASASSLGILRMQISEFRMQTEILELEIEFCNLQSEI